MILAADVGGTNDTSLTFNTLALDTAGKPITLTMPLQPKMIQDEMGEAFEREYGRMSGNLGVETPNAQAGLQNMILYAYAHPPSEVIKGVQLELPDGAAITPIATAVERATKAAFTSGVTRYTVAANATTLIQTGLPRNATYYYRVRAFNVGSTSAWVNAAPFPITTP